MANEHIKKYLTMKPEVSRIFDDLEAYKDYCRFNMLKFDERDLYTSEQWRKSQGMQRGGARKAFNQHKQQQAQ